MSSNELSPTVYGIETEYSHLISDHQGWISELVGECHSADVELGLYAAPGDTVAETIDDGLWTQAVTETGLIVNEGGMLSNGGRFYIDDSGIEYCTPETTTAEEAVIRSFDGDEIVHKVLQNLQAHNLIGDHQLNRRVVDHTRGSRGVHINTSTVLEVENDGSSKLIRQLACLNVAKGAIFGSGGLLINAEGKTEFHHSPRLSVTNETHEVKYISTERPLVRIPFTHDIDEISRVETVSGDALNFAWPLRASMVLTNAMMKLLETDAKVDLPLIMRRAEVDAAGLVGQFGNDCLIRVEQADGTIVVVRPVDIIYKICALIMQADEREEFLDSEARQVIPEIIDVVDRMANDIYSVANQVESMARLQAMQMKMEKDNLGLGSEEMCRFDYAWDRIGGGVAERFRRNGIGWHGFTTDSSTRLHRQRLVPPQNTRAKIRADFIRRAYGTDASEWNLIGNDFGDAVIVHPLWSKAPDDMPLPRVDAEQ